MIEQDVHLFVVQRIIIKYLTKKGVKPSEIFIILMVQFRDTRLSQNRVYVWSTEFEDKQEKIDNESHDRRPRTSFTDDNILQDRELHEHDRWLYVQ